MIAFKLLTAVDVAWRDLLPGVIVAAVALAGLQHLGGSTSTTSSSAPSELYGVFAIVLGLLAWLYLAAQLTIFAAEINVVRARRLWPRSFFSAAAARRRPASAHVLRRDRGARDEQNVEVSFDERARRSRPSTETSIAAR